MSKEHITSRPIQFFESRKDYNRFTSSNSTRLNKAKKGRKEGDYSFRPRRRITAAKIIASNAKVVAESDSGSALAMDTLLATQSLHTPISNRL
jgi:hypothetical protein